MYSIVCARQSLASFIYAKRFKHSHTNAAQVNLNSRPPVLSRAEREQLLRVLVAVAATVRQKDTKTIRGSVRVGAELARDGLSAVPPAAG